MSLDVMKQALEAIEWALDFIPPESETNCECPLCTAYDALDLAIEQAERQEPVAWREFDGEGGYDYRTYDDNENFRDEYIKRNGQRYASWVEPLYAAPPQRQPLTDKRIMQLLRAALAEGALFTKTDVLVFARELERAHGIGGGE